MRRHRLGGDVELGIVSGAVVTPRTGVSGVRERENVAVFANLIRGEQIEHSGDQCLAIVMDRQSHQLLRTKEPIDMILKAEHEKLLALFVPVGANSFEYRSYRRPADLTHVHGAFVPGPSFTVPPEEIRGIHYAIAPVMKPLWSPVSRRVPRIE